MSKKLSFTPKYFSLRSDGKYYDSTPNFGIRIQLDTNAEERRCEASKILGEGFELGCIDPKEDPEILTKVQERLKSQDESIPLAVANRLPGSGFKVGSGE